MWSIYYLLILRVVRFRSLKFRPRIATTLRPHGKWGDLIICIIPVSWCANIISNSNMILRMIEWQAETGLFTFRIRGKQWYWIYKFELKTLTDILTAPKNIGTNKWRIYTPGDIQSADDYLHILQLRAQNKWVQNYWMTELTKNDRLKEFHISSPQEVVSYNFVKRRDTLVKLAVIQDKAPFIKDIILDEDNISLKNTNKNIIYDKNNHTSLRVRLQNKKNMWNDIVSLNTKVNLFTKTLKRKINNLDVWVEPFSIRKEQFMTKSSLYESLNAISKKNYINLHNDLPEVTRWLKRSVGTLSPVRLLKLPITSKVDFSTDSDVVELFRFRFSDNESVIQPKPAPHSTFFSMKQKRYKRRKIILPREKPFRNIYGKPQKALKYIGKPALVDGSLLVENDLDATRQYTSFKKRKKREEMMSVVTSRRLLRTKRTLVLPAHVNLTAITNSYDVIHSWFIPGLGLKMDCIPGRSTHHTFFIDNVGFYYGQCAEICGRFHHHMPIRICALPFEHFLIWWHSFGLPKLLFTSNKKNYQTYYGFRKFVW